MTQTRRSLTVFDRSIIQTRLADGLAVRAIARQLGRSAGMVCDEINRHGGRAAYLAETAHGRAAAGRRLSGRKPRLASDGALLPKWRRCCAWAGRPSRFSGRRKRIE